MYSALKEKLHNKSILTGIILLAISLLCALIRDIGFLSYSTISLGVVFDYGAIIVLSIFVLSDFQISKRRTLLTITAVLLLARQLYWLFDEIVYYDIDTVNYVEYIVCLVAYVYLNFLSAKGTTKTKLAYILLGLIVFISFGYLVSWFDTNNLCYLAFDIAFLLIAPKAVKTEKISSVEEKLINLKELFDNGVIPEEEYRNRKEKILNDI